jgi:hypothetical protein
MNVTARRRAGKPIALRTWGRSFRLDGPLNLATEEGTVAAEELAGDLKVFRWK